MKLNPEIAHSADDLGAALIGRTIRGIRLPEGDSSLVDCSVIFDFSDGTSIEIVAAGSSEDELWWLTIGSLEVIR